MGRCCSFSIGDTGDRFVSVSWRNFATFTMTSAASAFRLPRCPWIPPSSLSGYDASTNYGFQFCATRKRKWCVRGDFSTPKKKAGLPSLQLFWSDAIAASD
jgi:hypothetical protein